MRWSERQLAMLREMGIRVWPVAGAALTTGADAASVAGPESELEVVTSNAVSALAATSSLASTAVARTGASEVAPAAPPLAHATEPARPAASAPALSSGHRPAGIEAMGWDTLREAVAICGACKLCEGRTQTVFGTGSTQAQWLIVGEAPGEQEDLQGEPFVGKSGQLLDSMLRAIGLTRGEAEPQRQVYIANTIKCRPPGNRNPELDELAQCEPFLIRQLALLQPRIIVAMGRFAVQSLLRSNEPVGALRGRVHRYQGVPLIVTYHPAYLLRNPQDKARAWDDLCLAVETAELAART